MSNLTPSLIWRGRTASLCLALLLAVGIAARAVALPNPQDSVRSFYDTLLTTMKAGATLGERGRYARLAPVIDRLFDVPAMARLAVGPILGDAVPDPAATGDAGLCALHHRDLR